jgi:hypothetical protein
MSRAPSPRLATMMSLLRFLTCLAWLTPAACRPAPSIPERGRENQAVSAPARDAAELAGPAEPAGDDSDEGVACRINALTPAERDAQRVATQRLIAAIDQVEVLPRGYGFALPSNAGLVADAALWSWREQRCCPFLHYTLEFGPDSARLWIRATGSRAAREMLHDTVVQELAARHVRGT